jgi:hypothetical protein
LLAVTGLHLAAGLQAARARTLRRPQPAAANDLIP